MEAKKANKLIKLITDAAMRPANDYSGFWKNINKLCSFGLQQKVDITKPISKLKFKNKQPSCDQGLFRVACAIKLRKIATILQLYH